jgi:uncharacterized protein (DUF2336 family)
VVELWIAIVQKADSSDLFDELDAALQSGSSEKRLAMLRQVTDLFLNEADRLDKEQIGVFDIVLVQLIERIESRTLMEISERLAPVANAPINLTVKLAGHSEIGIVRPILKSSSRLTTADLVAIAKTKSHGHLLAISERSQIERTVTDVLLDQANSMVVLSVASSLDIIKPLIPSGAAPKAGHDKPKMEFAKLSTANAKRLLRFWQGREASAKSA